MRVIKQAAMVLVQGLVSIPLGLLLLITHPLAMAHDWLDDKIGK